MRRIRHHFSMIAQKYKDLRTTDLLPLSIIKKKLENLTEIEAADVGCGVGRYDVREFEEALKEFSKNIARDFKDPDKIKWSAENIMLVIRKNVLR